MASTTENTASCALCRRHLLVGEPARLYQDPPSKRFAKVCPLCYERADRRGWRADGRPIVAVHANPPADQALRERESLIDRLRGQLQSVEFDLDQVRNALAKAEQQAGELRTVKRELKDSPASCAGASASCTAWPTRSAAPTSGPPRRRPPTRAEIARHHAVAAQLDEQAAEVGRIGVRLSAARAGARGRARAATPSWPRPGAQESDARHVRRLALEAFNRSQHIERVVAISRSLGDPIVNVAVDGLELPRPVLDHGRLGHLVVRVRRPARPARAHRHRRGGPPRRRPARAARRRGCSPTRVLRTDRIVLTMQAYGVGLPSASA